MQGVFHIFAIEFLENAKKGGEKACHERKWSCEGGILYSRNEKQIDRAEKKRGWLGNTGSAAETAQRAGRKNGMPRRGARDWDIWGAGAVGK